jgi:hypothetical protein
MLIVIDVRNLLYDGVRCRSLVSSETFFFVAASVPLSRWLIAECEFVNPCQVVFTVSLPQSDPWSPSACTVCPQLFRNNQYRFSTLLKFSSEIRVIFQKSRTSFWTSPVVIFGSSVTRKWSLALDCSIRILQLGIEKKILKTTWREVLTLSTGCGILVPVYVLVFTVRTWEIHNKHCTSLLYSSAYLQQLRFIVFVVIYWHNSDFIEWQSVAYGSR